MPTAAVVITETGNADQYLAQLPVLLRRGALKKAVKRAGEVVEKRAKALCPKGETDDGKKPLADTIDTVVRDYDGAVVAVTGPAYPAGAHGHLVEFGHAMVLWGRPTGRRVPAHPFLRPAADETKAQQEEALVGTLRAEAEK